VLLKKTMGSRMTTVAYISTALCIQAGLQCIISAYIAQNTIYLKFNLSLPILDKIATKEDAIRGEICIIECMSWVGTYLHCAMFH
jgi:hypothetical protein